MIGFNVLIKDANLLKLNKDKTQDDMAEDVDDNDNNSDSEDELDIIRDKFVGGGNNVNTHDPESGI